MKTNRTPTAKRLVASFVSLAICFSMFMGSTFAWFTDTASSGVNTIVAGNLDMLVEYASAFNTDGSVKTWSKVDANTKLFEDDTLWEPGHTEVAYLRVTNKGSLAFKYQCSLNSKIEKTSINVKDNTEFKLSDVLKFGTVVSDSAITPYTDRAEVRNAVDANAVSLDSFAKINVTPLYPTGKGTNEQYVAIAVYMPESTGNEANHITGHEPPSISFGITLVATQYESEEDSFGNDYDSGAVLPQMPVVIDTVGSTVVENTGETPVDITVEAETVDGKKATAVIPAAAVPVSKKVEAQLTVQLKDSDSGSSTYDIDVSLFEIAADGTKTDIELNGYAVPVTVPLASGLENVKVTHNATPMTEGASAEGLNNGEYFYNKTSGVLSIKSDSFSPFVITYDEKEGFEFTGDTAWYEQADENTDEFIIDTAEELFGFAQLVNAGNSFDGKTVKLGKNIDLKNVEWTPIGFNNSEYFRGTFDGQGHTISNINASGSSYVGFFGVLYNATVKDVLLDNVALNCSAYSGALAGLVAGANNFINVDAKNININATSSCIGGLVGCINNSAKEQNNFTNCDILADEGKTNTIKAPSYYVGGMLGYTGGSVVSFTNCIVDSVSISDTLGYAGGMVGYAYSGELKIMNNRMNELTILSPGTYGYVGGMVGCTYLNPAAFEKNIVTNITITSRGEAAAGIVARAAGNYKTTITDCHIEGDIQISSAGYTAGIVSRVEYYGNSISNCSVIGAEGTNSIIDGGNSGGYIGGIFGWMPEGNFAVDNCQVKNIAINAGQKVGGIGGMLHYQNIATNLTVENVAITAHGTAESRGLLFGENNADKAADKINKIYNYTITDTTINGKDAAVISSIAYGPKECTGGTFACPSPVFDANGKVIGGKFDVADITLANKILAEGYILDADNCVVAEP